jgi:Dolichyl-phosphate-mannose-protein mannosyltransferase
LATRLAGASHARQVPLLRIDDHSLPERAVRILGWVILVSSWVGLLLAELGHFSGAGMLAGSGAVLICGVILNQRLFQPRSVTSALSETSAPDVSPSVRFAIQTAEFVGIAAILLIGLSLDLHPEEAVFGTHDAGVRINAAAHLASSGQIPIHDPNLLAAANAGVLAEPLGVYATDPATGTAYPQFSGVAEVWDALALDTIGLPASLVHGYQAAPTVFPARPLFLTAVFALLAELILFVALRRAFGPVVALTTVAALALCYPQIYYSRLTMAEIPTELFGAIALLGLVLYWQEQRTDDAALAGGALGLAWLTHIDIVLLVLPVAGWFAYLVARRQLRRGHVTFFTVAGVLAVEAGWHYARFEAVYLQAILDGIANLARIGWLLVAPSTAVLVILGWFVARHPKRVETIALNPRVRLATAGLFVAAALFAYAVRPLLDPPAVILVAGSDVPLVRNGAVALVILGRYVGPIAFALALVGSVMTIARGSSRGQWAIFLAGALYLSFYDWSPLVSPPQPFWVRRFVPVVIPAIFVLASIAIVGLGRLTRRSWLRRVVVGGLSAALIASVVQISLPLASLPPEDQGGLAQMDALAHVVPPDSVMLLDGEPSASWLALPLTYLFHNDAYAVTQQPFDPERLNPAIDGWLGQGKSVVVVTSGGKTSLDTSRWGFIPLGTQRFQFPQFPVQYWDPPTTVQSVDFRARAYQVVPVQSQPLLAFPFTVQIGGDDYGYIASGFLRNDDNSTSSFRWTGPEAVVDLPRPPTPTTRITLYLGGRRPVGSPPAHVQLTLDGKPLGQVGLGTSEGDVDADFHYYPFEATVDHQNTSGRMRLKLSVNTWQPAAAGYPDSRDLGVAIIWIRVDAIASTTPNAAPLPLTAS